MGRIRHIAPAVPCRQPQRHQRGDEISRRHDDIVPPRAGVQLRKHLLIALEHIIGDPDAELALELRDGGGGDVVRPVVDRELPLERGQRPFRIVIRGGTVAETAGKRGRSHCCEHFAAGDAAPSGRINPAHPRPVRAG